MPGSRMPRQSSPPGTALPRDPEHEFAGDAAGSRRWVRHASKCSRRPDGAPTRQAPSSATPRGASHDARPLPSGVPDAVVIRLADPDRDGPAVAAVYAPSVAASVASFELEPPDGVEMAARIARTLAWSPWLVAESGGQVVGYAYATRHRERAGYRWAVDLSVYVAPGRQGSGIGRRLYETLLPILRGQGFLHAYAGITPPNPASLALHTAIGMTPSAPSIASASSWAPGGASRGWVSSWCHSCRRPREPTPLPVLLGHARRTRTGPCDPRWRDGPGVRARARADRPDQLPIVPAGLSRPTIRRRAI